jgi:Protein of unknown function (DUF2855)
MDFLLKRDDLHECRVGELPEADLEPGQAELRIDAFGLTANNITYAVFGEAMRYWNFFPAEDGWGRMPVWGFAEVSRSEVEGLEQGARIYGYLPPSSRLVVTPSKVGGRGFVDAAPHRADLPSPYNSYLRVDEDPSYDEAHEAEQMLFRPLFFTSFVNHDFLEDNDCFGAGTAVMSSASSKTALGTAFLLSRRDGLSLVGLTSEGNVGFVEGLGLYDQVVRYDDVASLPKDKAIYVDMSGNPNVRAAVHEHYGDDLAYDCVVGDTHWDRNEDVGELPGPKPTFFFAPDRIAVRTKDWGADGLEARYAEAWQPFVEWTGGWLEVVRDRGPEAIERVYRELLDGRTDPKLGHILSPGR